MEGENNMNQNAGPEVAPVTPAENQPKATDNKTLMAALSYVSILVLIPYLMAKNDPFVHYHIKQGLVLLVIELAVYVLGMVIWMLYPVLGLINLATLVLSIIGIVNVVQGKEKELPLVGSFSKHFDNV
jgi:uncharacterized membrane protein